MDNKNLPAFPVECSYDENSNVKGCQTGNTTGWEKGLSKRELIAAMALQGLLANPNSEVANEAAAAVLYADDLLTELNKQPAP